MAELQMNARARRFHIEEPNQKLTHIEDLAVRLDVARSMQKQYGWWGVVQNGCDREIEILTKVLDICRTDPAHKRDGEKRPSIFNKTDTNGVTGMEYIAAQLPKAVSWDEAMQGRERDFNKRYYNNPDGEPKFPHEVKS